MGRSCVYYSDQIDQYHVALDNLIIAKKLYDIGKELPMNIVFNSTQLAVRENYFFLNALEILTDGKISILIDTGDELGFSLEIPHWDKTLHSHKDLTTSDEYKKFEYWNVYTEIEATLKITDVGIELYILGTGVYCYLFEDICDQFSILNNISEVKN